MAALIRLYVCVDSTRRPKLYLLVATMVVAAVCEVFSIGALFPLLSVMVQPELILKNPHFIPILEFTKIQSATELLFPLTLLFSCAVIVSAGVRLAVLKYTSEVAYGIGAELSADIFQRTLLQPYLTHVGRNSSQIIDGLTSKNTALIECVRCCVNITSASILLLLVGAALIYFNPLVTTSVLICFGAVYILISRATKPIFTKNGVLISTHTEKMVKEIQESIGGIREIILNKSADFHAKIYHETVVELMRARAQNNYAGGAPRHGIEASGMVLMAGLAYYFFTYGATGNSIIPTLGVVALASQRALPILQQRYSSWSDLLAQRASLVMALQLLEQKIPLRQAFGKTLAFDQSIVLQQVEFQYSANDQYAIRGLNIVIRKGERVAIVGPTGGGKSTLLDILMAIIHPTSGTIAIDGVIVDAKNAELWHAHIAHVPQNIFLADKTIAENIAFGQNANRIDMARVENVAKQVSLSDAIAQIPGGYSSRVGERGIQLSGGQRQRIAIARALYRNADVIILDEATSALDDQTEAAIMETIRNVANNVTIIMVTHREKALEGFDSIYLLKDANLTNITQSRR